MNFKVVAAAAALLASQSFAIIGIGGHYAPGIGTKMDAAAPTTIVAHKDADLATGTLGSPEIQFGHSDFSGIMQGFGFKLWIDILPIIDIEATMNIQFGSYDATLYVEGADPVPLEIELAGTPFGLANPKFVHMNADVSITYPLTFIPVIRPYIGGGPTYFMNSFVLNQSFMSKLMADPTIAALLTGDVNAIAGDLAQGQDPAAAAQEKAERLKQSVQDAAMDEGLKQSIGGHVLVGFRAKLPIIPIAAYANFKYYFGGKYVDEISSGNMAVEVGGGFAI